MVECYQKLPRRRGKESYHVYQYMLVQYLRRKSKPDHHVQYTLRDDAFFIYT